MWVLTCVAKLQDHGAEGIDGEDQTVLVVAHRVPWHLSRVAEGRESFFYGLKIEEGLVQMRRDNSYTATDRDIIGSFPRSCKVSFFIQKS